MREIKYRGKRLDNGEWVYGYYFIDERDIEDGIIWRDIPQIQQRYGDHYNYFDVIPETVGQFTGLHDKNGKEIYESDVCIVSLSYFKIKDEKATVVFHNGAFQFQYGCEKFFSKPHDAWDEMEVIGSIHDNPDLLKEDSHAV